MEDTEIQTAEHTEKRGAITEKFFGSKIACGGADSKSNTKYRNPHRGAHREARSNHGEVFRECKIACSGADSESIQNTEIHSAEILCSPWLDLKTIRLQPPSQSPQQFPLAVHWHPGQRVRVSLYHRTQQLKDPNIH